MVNEKSSWAALTICDDIQMANLLYAKTWLSFGVEQRDESHLAVDRERFPLGWLNIHSCEPSVNDDTIPHLLFQ